MCAHNPLCTCLLIYICVCETYLTYIPQFTLASFPFSYFWFSSIYSCSLKLISLSQSISLSIISSLLQSQYSSCVYTTKIWRVPIVDLTKPPYFKLTRFNALYIPNESTWPFAFKCIDSDWTHFTEGGKSKIHLCLLKSKDKHFAQIS